MKAAYLLAPLFLLAGLSSAAVAADTNVTLSNVHLCCGKCITGAEAALKPVTGAKADISAPDKTITITAPDKATAQKAVDALVAAGYFGKSSDDSVKLDASTGATEEKVKTLEVSGVHLCCGSCVTAVNAVADKVPGITGKTIKPNAKTISFTGDFSSKAFFDELQKAGLTGKVAAPAKPQ